MTQNMGVSSDDTMSPCRAKDPDHCRYHKKGSHVPMDQKKMMEWNENVLAKADNGVNHSLSKSDSKPAGAGKTTGMHIMDIENQLKDYINNNHKISDDLDAYSSFDFDDLVDAIKEYSEENDGINKLSDIDEDDLEEMIGTYSTDADIIDNDGNEIPIDAWGNVTDLMEEDDEDAFNDMNEESDGHSAQELFDMYSKEYKNNNGKDWTPDFNK